jgi:hypothetical protein
MAARVRTLKWVNKTIETINRGIKNYAATGNLDMEKVCQAQLRDAKYLKSLVEKDIEDDRYRASCKEAQSKEKR